MIKLSSTNQGTSTDALLTRLFTEMTKPLFFIGFGAYYTGGNLCLVLKIWSKPRAREVIMEKGELPHVVLMNGHVVKLPSKYLCAYL